MDQEDMNMLSPCVFSVMALYFLQSVEPSVLPIIHNVYGQTQTTKNDDLLYDDKFECYLKSYVSGLANETFFLLQIFNQLVFKMDSMSWKSENSDSIGLLWLNMLAFYSFDYTFKDVYLSVRSKTKACKTAFKIHGKKIAIEGEPCCQLKSTNDPQLDFRSELSNTGPMVNLMQNLDFLIFVSD
jgi:hypothetical protein